jgi:tRNA modification GTPase
MAAVLRAARTETGMTVQPHPQTIESESVAQETIVAISTPPGRGGIGIVRLSGSHAAAIAKGLIRSRAPLEHARARFAEILEPESGSKLDEAIVTYFARPNSYTGEDLVEIAAHGSPVILEMLVRLALRAGARLARPGEFTERAFLAGRLDLIQAEAVRDLIEAQTLYQARVAAEQMGGALSRRVHPAKQRLVELIALLEAGVDFAEDDVEVTPDAEIVTRIDAIVAELQALARSFERGRIVREGLRLAIVGRPNVGKSSLFNRLLERERAIVTSTPGTTRDMVTERLSLAGVPVELVDTAGLRHTTDEAEAMGVEKSREMLADADLVLLVLDASAPLSEEERELMASLSGRQAVVVWNKCDLMRDSTDAELPAEPREGALFPPSAKTSALTGTGITELRDRLSESVTQPAGESEGGILTNLRHYEAVSGALQALAAAKDSVASRVPHEMVLLDLYGSLRHIDSLTGETTAEDILGRIFSSFCIGK